MKLKKIKFIMVIILLNLLVVASKVYAKSSIEIKPNSSNVYTNKTISEFFDECLLMGTPGEGLESDNVDVHMSTNMDWAIVAYFSNSAYGTNGEGQNAGIKTSINGKEYLSTNGNITGVMDFGKTQTLTAGVISNYIDIEDTEETEEPYDYGKSIIENVGSNQHVELVSSNSIKSIALTGWHNSSGGIGNDVRIPYSVRFGLFGGRVGGGAGFHNGATGEAMTTRTFRPAIWN